jgi:chaperonin GroEL
LPGGGVALGYVANQDWEFELNAGELRGLEILQKALLAPFTKILQNAGLSVEKFTLPKWGKGVDVTCGCIKDMVDIGIVDPLLVTKTALNNAVSVATTILSTDCVISNVREQ